MIKIIIINTPTDVFVSQFYTKHDMYYNETIKLIGKVINDKNYVRFFIDKDFKLNDDCWYWLEDFEFTIH